MKQKVIYVPDPYFSSTSPNLFEMGRELEADALTKSTLSMTA